MTGRVHTARGLVETGARSACTWCVMVVVQAVQNVQAAGCKRRDTGLGSVLGLASTEEGVGVELEGCPQRSCSALRQRLSGTAAGGGARLSPQRAQRRCRALRCLWAREMFFIVV